MLFAQQDVSQFQSIYVNRITWHLVSWIFYCYYCFVSFRYYVTILIWNRNLKGHFRKQFNFLSRLNLNPILNNFTKIKRSRNTLTLLHQYIFSCAMALIIFCSFTLLGTEHFICFMDISFKLLSCHFLGNGT